MKPTVDLPHEPTCAWPFFDSDDEAAVLRILRDGNVSTHPVIRELEADWARFTGRRHGLAHASGTAGLMAAFFALDLQPGDEVLVPTATFWASVLPMLWFGLVPVFCESESERLGPCPVDMARRITPRTRAMVVVHLWGLPAKMSELRALADQHGLAIVEDASHTHGATWRGRACGSLGDVSVLSLQGDKLAPAGEGGILLTDDDQIHERATCLGDITRIIELDSVARRFAATSFGVKTRIAPLSAALGRSQLAKLPDLNARRNANHRRLCLALEALGFETFLGPDHVERVWFEFIVRHRDPARDVDALIERLTREGCRAAAPRYPLLHQQPFFAEGHWRQIARVPSSDATMAGVDELADTARENRRLIRLPNFPGPDNGIVDQYAEAFARAVE
ncbi:DegT/DnrJ/EryC1/StrS family aminotransferase [Engelhardtia mirabilis]|uniref:UDP-4-amino-4-deoxy-L-arabinose--oxoglutarate aminotransferase n=1 Tax=Engelhardtia mirabilis TaxID=2528011 RepID=A0A518BRK6_9BACT|nr:UDP-4-amino-4-deoxy-L-arabinose--oxoglutarate aminotransferase [Planctomycetes bacterium Pla133]QDV03922.1 UDP-4-amino-4-deoxy-L-arabinose--oxoglutarate aminotransferase [Planctomycetes bacterium Pla86]